MKSTAIYSAVGLAIAMAIASSANAQTVSVSNTTATINAPSHVSTITMANFSDAAGFEVQLTYGTGTDAILPLHTAPPMHPRISTTEPNILCSVLVAGQIRCGGFHPTGTLAQNFTISVDFSIGPNPVPAPGVPLVITDARYTDSAANEIILPGGSLTDGSIVIVTGPPPDVIVTFTPASGGTVTFPGGMPADVVAQSIAIGNTGTIGSGTVSGCVLGGADAGSFAITGGNPSTVPPATSLDLSATLGAAALNATLTCNVTDSTGTSTATWTLTAPAGTVLAAPTLAANPASGTAITLPNSYGTPVSSNIVITPTGGDAGGPNASVTCSTASAGFTVTPAGALTFTPPGGAAQNAVVGCTPGAAAITGTVTCTGTDQAGAIAWTYPVTCPAASTAPPPPTFVPATSLWSKLALFGVFAALGMLILGLRRNH